MQTQPGAAQPMPDPTPHPLQGSLLSVTWEQQGLRKPRPPKSLHLCLRAVLTALMVSQFSLELLKNTSYVVVITNLEDVIELILLMSPPEGRAGNKVIR